MLNGYIAACSTVSMEKMHRRYLGEWRSERFQSAWPLVPLDASVMAVHDWLSAHGCSWTLDSSVR